MIIEVLRSKIHGATVTDSNINYEGSLGIGKNLIKKVGLYLNEKIDVYNITNGNRFSTYVIEAADSEICINGAASHLADVGDKIIIASYGGLEEKNIANHKAKVIILNSNNGIK